MNTNRLTPEQYDEDAAFVHASTVVYDGSDDRWTIHIDRDDYLVGDGLDKSIQDVQSERPSKSVEGPRTKYEGRILFSGGVITLVNDTYVLIHRDAGADSAPECWTSPAGRAEHDPGTTARKEFYEELLILEGDTPVFVDDGASSVFEPVYEETLRDFGITVPREDWHRVRGKTPERWQNHLSTVVTEFGNDTWSDEMLAFYDEASNTLELRFVVEIDVETELSTEFSFHDGEFEREVRRFSSEQLRDIGTENLVPTDAYVLDEVLPELNP